MVTDYFWIYRNLKTKNTKIDIQLKIGRIKMDGILNEAFIKNLQVFQDKFSEFFGVASAIFDDTGKMLTEPSGFTDFCKTIRATEEGGKACRDSKKGLFDIVANGEPATYHCAIFSQLADAIVPVMWKGKVVAAWAIGQKRVEDIPRSEINETANRIEADANELWNNYKKLPITTMYEFEKAVYFLHITICTIMRMREQDIELKDALDRFITINAIAGHDMGESIETILSFIKLLDDRYRTSESEEFKEFVSYIVPYGEKLKKTSKMLTE